MTAAAKPLRLGLLQYPVERPDGVAALEAKLDAWLARGRAGGAEVMVLPEYACVEIGSALCGLTPPDAPDEIAAVTERAEEILAAMRRAAMRAEAWLLPGTLPMRRADGTVVNRAPFIAPDGRIAFQDKRQTTRYDAEQWGLAQGAPPSVFETPWGRLGIAVCYDVEFPKLVRAQVEAGAWLILVPTCTDTMHGFNRVRLGASARAMENQCFVAIAPTVGLAPWSAGLDSNRGYAAVFGPVDRGFPEDGVLARGALDEAGWVFCDLDPARIEQVRRDGAVLNHRDWPRSPLPRVEPAVFA